MTALEMHTGRKYVSLPRAGDGRQDMGPEFASSVRIELSLRNLERPFGTSIARVGLRRIRLHVFRPMSAALDLVYGMSVNAEGARLGHGDPTIITRLNPHAQDHFETEAAQRPGKFLGVKGYQWATSHEETKGKKDYRG